MTNTNAKDFLNTNLIEELQLEELSLEEQAKMLDSISGAVMTAIVARALSMIDEDSQKEFTKFLGTAENPSQILDFFSKKIPDFQDVVGEEVAKFKKESVEFFGKIK